MGLTCLDFQFGVEEHPQLAVFTQQRWKHPVTFSVETCALNVVVTFFTPRVINIKVLINVAETTERQSPADGLILDVLLPKLIWEG